MTVMFAASAVPVLGFSSVAIEFADYSRVRTNMMEALESAGLAISQKAQADGMTPGSLTEEQTQFLKDFGRDFFEANFASLSKIDQFSLDFDISTTTVTPRVQGRMKTSMLGVMGIDYFTMNDNVEITLQGSGKLEIALVLDVTGSMDYCASGDSYNCETRMEVLKDTVDTMFDTLIGSSDTAVNDDVKVAIVPFNSLVTVVFD